MSGAAAGIAGSLLGTMMGIPGKTVEETAMYPVKKGIKTMYGDTKPQQPAQAPQPNHPRGFSDTQGIPSDHPALPIVGQAAQMATGGGLYGGHPVMKGIGNGILAMASLGLGQDPMKVIAQQQQLAAQEKQAQAEQQQRQAEQQQLAAQHQADAQQRAGEFSQTLALDQETAKQKAEADKATREQRASEFAATSAQNERKIGLDEKQIGLQSQQFNAEMGLKGQDLALKRQDLELKLRQQQAAQEAMAALGKTLFPDIASGMEGHQAAANPQYTPEQQQLLKAAMGSDPTGKTALMMAAQFQKEANAPLTEAQGNAAMFGHRATEANDALNASTYQPSVLPNTLRNFGEQHPTLAPSINYLLNGMAPDSQQFNVWAEDFTRAALRKESGATITPDEDLKAKTLWIPQPGDTKNVLDAKKVARQHELEGMAAAAGPKGTKAFGGAAVADPLGIR